MVTDSTDTQTLEAFISDHIQARIGDAVPTTTQDTGTLHHNYEHLTVSHSNRQYLDGLAHTNQIQELATASIPESTGQGLIFAIESFWAKAKRAIIGTYHAISRKHLQKYINE